MRTQNLLVAQHPLILDRLSKLRDRTTEPPLFRQMVHDLSQMLFFEATRNLRLTPAKVMTPLGECATQTVAETIGLVPILRAALGMSTAILPLVPTAQVWHLGLYRDHETRQPITYYHKLTGRPSIERCFVLDPMLATGGSACAAVTLLKEWGMKHIHFLGLIAAPEGVKALGEAHPDVDITLGAIDNHLNELSYIVPGLGDAGDRQFGTF